MGGEHGVTLGFTGLYLVFNTLVGWIPRELGSSAALY